MKRLLITLKMIKKKNDELNKEKSFFSNKTLA